MDARLWREGAPGDEGGPPPVSWQGRPWPRTSSGRRLRDWGAGEGVKWRDRLGQGVACSWSGGAALCCAGSGCLGREACGWWDRDGQTAKTRRPREKAALAGGGVLVSAGGRRQERCLWPVLRQLDAGGSSGLGSSFINDVGKHVLQATAALRVARGLVSCGPVWMGSLRGAAESLILLPCEPEDWSPRSGDRLRAA